MMRSGGCRLYIYIYIYIYRWVQIECAGVGCRHRLPLKIAPLLMVASTKVTYPSREFIGTRLPYGGGGPGGGTGDAQGRGGVGWGGVGAGAGDGPPQGEVVMGSRELATISQKSSIL